MRCTIFVSSPGDVREEPERAHTTVEHLRRRYAGRIDLKALFWEDMPLQADTSFQRGIDYRLCEENAIEIAVFILWSRLGSPLGESEYRSGTEREFHFMIEARERSENKRPQILVYTRNDETSFHVRLRG